MTEKRYTCAHADCLPASDRPIIFFPTWSALQNHTRTVHPPMCTHSSCNGRIFSNAGNLRAHLKLHAQRDEEGQLNAALAPSKEGGKEDQPPKKRRRGGEYGRDWKCSVENCEKDFKSVGFLSDPGKKGANVFQNKALTVHHNVTHLGKRDHICAHVDCGAFFGYKHLLQRHITRAHSKPAEESAHDVDSGASSFSGSGFPESGHFESNTLAAAPVMSLDIATITGVAYSARAEKLLKETKVFCCPFPHLGDHKIKFIVVSAEDDTEIILDETTTTEPTSDVAGLIGPNCQYVFSRGYDLRRHLRAVHKLDTAKESVDRWVKKLKDSTQRN
ncbi:hypothetical protein D9757_005592 [Collybiopsis confluens]|uniref:C2H2-type domain-containing protein n=1 Tax=Collybiopsis confluens TaxID=2823264 RepID=A0A8H5MCF9_9AGAR|nr:hypothetical protein D9757_005592 [Collybiopsis confluens]